MRIAINVRLLVPGKMDGIGWFTYETTRRLVQSHPEHQFLLLFDRHPDPRFNFGDNAHSFVLPPPARHPVLWWVFFEISIPIFLGIKKVDIFISPDGFLPLHTHIPTLSIIHDINFAHSNDNLRPSHQKFMAHFFPKYARLATRVATVSEYSRRDIAATYGIASEKIDVVYDGAASSYRPHSKEEQSATRQRFTQGQPYLLFVSTILKRKNLANLLLAFDRIKDNGQENLKLVVVGNRVWWAEELSSAYNSMRHRDDVIMPGHLEPDDLASLMSAAQALVYPSFFEGFGIPILEAMYAETAVICSNTTSMPEVGGDAALYIDPSDVESISHAISRIADEKLRSELIAKGRIQREKYSWDKTSEALWYSILKTTNSQ